MAKSSQKQSHSGKNSGTHKLIRTLHRANDGCSRYPEVNLFAASTQAARILTVWYILGKIDA
jgi:hypothetical protein